MSNNIVRSASSWRNVGHHEDLQEEHVWNVVIETENKPFVSSSSAWRHSKRIPKSNNYHTNIYQHDHDANVGVKQQASAPLNIPDWPKIYGTKTSSGDYGYDDINGGGDDDGEDMVPPHEWIARKLARSQISSFSVCEGIGRTLKGRDLSQVRNSILTKTGFLE